MENSSQRIPLILLSLAFVVIGIIFVLSLSKGVVFPNMCLSGIKLYSQGELVTQDSSNRCYCTNGRVICSKVADLEVDSTLKVSDFTREKLVFTYKYFSSGVSSELLSKKLGVSFRSVVTGSDSITVELIQSQFCNEKGVPPVQIGLYHFSNGTLTLMNVINRIESVYTQPCTVSQSFRVNDVDIKKVQDFKLAYRNEDGEGVNVDVCLYNSQVYNDGDNYVSIDGCNVCRCIGGVSKCGTDRVCSEKD